MRELERTQHQLGYFLGKNLDHLSFAELDELELTMYRSLRSVSQAKKERLERDHRVELVELKRRLAEASSLQGSPGESGTATPDSSLDGDPKKSAKKLRFATVEVRTMNRAPGEGVPRSGTAPLGLGWQVVAEEVKSINDYESERRRKEARLGPLPEDRREKILLKAGATQADLDHEKSVLAAVLKDRENSEQERAAELASHAQRI